MESILFLLPQYKPMHLKTELSFGLGKTKNCVKNGFSLSLGSSGTNFPKVVGPSQVTSIPVTDEISDKIDTLVMQIKEIFRSMNDGEISPSAYDTAWVSRIPSIDDPTKLQFPSTIDWILKNQHEDGSWGEPSFFLLYDRLVCTLSCVLALKIWSRGPNHIDKGLKFLQVHIKQLENESSNLRTSGFELVFPSMLKEAKSIGLDLPYDVHCLKEIFALREEKIKRIPCEMMHSIHTTMLYSLEALQEVVHWKIILKLQSNDGSFLSSISATAIAYMKTGDRKCLEFLTNVIRRFKDHAPCHYPIDLLERIWAVDTIQRLGIDHYFKKEISNTLSYVYLYVGKEGVSWGRDNPIPDIDDTCMALRLLRLHGYPVSSDILNHFKYDNGEFICFRGETHRGISDMFNLYRFSQTSFPGEKILEEAKSFVMQYLQTCLKNKNIEDKWSLKKALHEEVEHALKHPWITSLQRLEVREYMNHYGENDVWIAKSLHRWNPSLVQSLPMRVKVAFKIMYETYNELSTQASNAQGKNAFPYLHNLRLKQIQDYLMIREIREETHVASWKEYIETGIKDCGVAIRVLPAMLLMGEFLDDDLLQCLDDRSEIHNRLSLYLRLLIDITNYENKITMESTSPICSIMNEEKCTEEDALKYMKKLKDDTFRALVYEYLKPSHVPKNCRRLIFEHGRIANFFQDLKSVPHLYKERINIAIERMFSPI